MKRFIGTLIVTLMMMSSQASTILKNGEHYTDTNRYATRPPTVIRNGQAHANIPRIPKFKVLRANPHRLSHFITDDDDDGIEDDSLITSYRRRDLNKVEHEDGISEKVRWRLFLARQLAMMKYHSLHT